jgi:hypothetical protein
VNAGLIVFIAVLALDVAGLLLDSVLYLLSAPTVSDFVRTGTPLGTLVGIVIVLLQVVGLGGGIAYHFWGVK